MVSMLTFVLIKTSMEHFRSWEVRNFIDMRKGQDRKALEKSWGWISPGRIIGFQKGWNYVDLLCRFRRNVLQAKVGGGETNNEII